MMSVQHRDVRLRIFAAPDAGHLFEAPAIEAHQVGRDSGLLFGRDGLLLGEGVGKEDLHPSAVAEVCRHGGDEQAVDLGAQAVLLCRERREVEGDIVCGVGVAAHLAVDDHHGRLPLVTAMQAVGKQQCLLASETIAHIRRDAVPAPYRVNHQFVEAHEDVERGGHEVQDGVETLYDEDVIPVGEARANRLAISEMRMSGDEHHDGAVWARCRVVYPE